MPSAYLPIFIHAGLAVALAGLIILVALYVPALVGNRRPSPSKSVPYESGIRPLVSTRRRVPVRFYLIAMLFLAFDIEVIFFFPWAVTFGGMRNAGMSQFLPFLLAELVVFVVVLLVGYVYVWKKGAFEWE